MTAEEKKADIAKNKAIALQKIKDYWPDIEQSGIDAIMANIQAETSFLSTNTMEGGPSWKNNRSNKALSSINGNMDDWAKTNNYTEDEAEVAYNKLTDVQKNGVRYQADENKEGGGYGALQITVNNYGLESRSDTLDKISKTLIDPKTNKPYTDFNTGVKPGLAEGDFSLGLDLSFSYYKNEHHKPWTTGDGGSFDLNNISGHELRYNKGGINRFELTGQKDADGNALKNPKPPKHVSNAFGSYNTGVDTSEDSSQESELDTKWKRDLLEEVKSTINEGDGRQYSNKDLLAFSDVIDGMSYEEAKNQFGIETDEEGDGFSINIGQQTLQSQVNLVETEVKTADVKTRLQAVINDSNSTIEEVEAAKQNIIDLDSNLEGLKDRLENQGTGSSPILDSLIPINPNDPRAQSEQANTAFVTGGSSSLIDQINSNLDARYGEQDVDDEGVVVNAIGNEREADGDTSVEEESTGVNTPYEFDVREAKTLGLMYDENGQTYDPEQLENMMIKPEGLMDYEQYSVWNEQQIADPNASFEEFQGLSEEDYTALLDENSVNESEDSNNTDNEYFDLRGEGAFEESFLDKLGGISSLIGLATGAIGLGAALKDVDIPKDPKLGPAFQQRLSESKRLAQQGLTPSELAKAHNDLDSSYATGIENIVRGSAGNRAQFMAGLGGLDVARQSALMDIAVADAGMQRQNQQKYDSMMMVNEQYEAGRQAKYQDAQFAQDTAKQAAGAALAGTSMSMIANAIGDRHLNRYNKMKTEKLMMDMGYKATKDGKSGQKQLGTDENGDKMQTSFTLPDQTPNLLSGSDQAVNTQAQGINPQNKGTNPQAQVFNSPIIQPSYPNINQGAQPFQNPNDIASSLGGSTTSGLINYSNENQVGNLGQNLYDIFK